MNEENIKTFGLGKISNVGRISRDWEEIANFLDMGKSLVIKLDTGVQCNVL